MKISKEQILGWFVSVCVGIIILLFLIFSVIKTIIPHQDAGGVLVHFGNIDEASGLFEPENTGGEALMPSEIPSPELPSEVSLVTQNVEESVALTEIQKKEKERREEEQRKKREEEQRRQNISNQVSGAFGAVSSQSTSQGTGAGRGNQGSPQGNSDEGENTGIGGYGSFSLNGRSLGKEGLPRPAYSVQESGLIVIRITVNPSGNVIAAEIGQGTTIVDATMRNSAKEAAKKAKFNKTETLNNQSGTITYRYQLN